MTPAELIVAAVVAAATVPLARIAYRCGWRRAAPRLPPALVAELRTHKLSCLGEPAERVTLELSLLLGTDRHGDAATIRKRSDARA
jgi:hypothetical protein